MLVLLDTFSNEVIRVAREVGIDGKLGGQAKVKGVSGSWLDLTDSVNSIAGNLTSQVRDISKVAIGIAQGDLSKNIIIDARGEVADLKDTINNFIENLRTFSKEVTTVALQVGTEVILGGQANVKGVGGVLADLTTNVNTMATNLTSQVREIARVTTTVADEDLSQKISIFTFN